VKQINNVRFCKSVNSGRAFTLVELLVVIAIIVILAALLLPLLSNAKNHAAKAVDLNNFKQIMVAVHLYVGDNGDVLPMPNWDNGLPSPSGWLYMVDSTMANDNPARFILQKGLLWNVLVNPKIYVCPMDNPANLAYGARPQQISSYVMNGAVVGYGAIITPLKLAAMLPTDCAFWETDEKQPDCFNDGANSPDEGVTGRHSQGGAQAAFDGSASYVRQDNWYKHVGDTNKNSLWCYPDSLDGR
jgi:prepilin-type N-terminal cleavage/methylation domain-containing protein